MGAHRRGRGDGATGSRIGVYGRIGALAALMGTAPACTEPCDECLVILPVGDSLTRGKDAYPSYRYFLAESLDERGVPMDFVGTRFGAGGRAAGDPPEVAITYDRATFPNDWDQDHEGRSGATIGELADGFGGWSARLRPDVDLVLVMAGTNDVLQGVPAADSVANLRRLTDALGSTFGDARVLVATPPPIEMLDQAHAELATALSSESTDADLVLVDMSMGFDASEMRLEDGVDLVDDGDRFVADAWLQALELELEELWP